MKKPTTKPPSNSTQALNNVVIQIAAKMVKQSTCKIVLITGAGMSAESGLGTIDETTCSLLTHEQYVTQPKQVLDWHADFRRTAKSAALHKGYLAMRAWSQINGHADRLMVITFNFDGLHTRAQHPNVIEMHGSVWQNRCERCSQVSTVAPNDDSHDFACRKCYQDGRPNTVWLDETVLPEAMSAAKQAIFKLKNNDLIIVVGCSMKTVVQTELVGLAEAQTGPNNVYEINSREQAIKNSLYIKATASAALSEIFSSK